MLKKKKKTLVCVWKKQFRKPFSPVSYLLVLVWKNQEVKRGNLRAAWHHSWKHFFWKRERFRRPVKCLNPDWNVCCDASSLWFSVSSTTILVKKPNKQSKVKMFSIPRPQSVSLPALYPPHHRAPEVGCCAAGRVRHWGANGSSSRPASCVVNK